MKKFFQKLGLMVLLLILAILFGRFTYWMQDKYGYEWLWTFVRLLPLTIILIYLSFSKKK